MQKINFKMYIKVEWSIKQELYRNFLFNLIFSTVQQHYSGGLLVIFFLSLSQCCPNVQTKEYTTVIRCQFL